MRYPKHLSRHPLYIKFQKICRQLQQLMKDAKQASAEKIKALLKRRDHYLKKLMQLQQPAIAGCCIIGLSVLVSASAGAQECKTYHDANASNPLPKFTYYPYPSPSPFFVDIDGDGDLDCYESYPDAEKRFQLIFLRNNGTKNLPYFQVDTATGFDLKNEIKYTNNVSEQEFVDIDGDGDYDCFIGEYFGSPKIWYYKNTGTNKVPHFERQPQSENPVAIAGSYGSELYFRFIDFDGDGDYDLTTEGFYSNLYGPNNFLNVGTATNPVFEPVDGYKNFVPEIPFVIPKKNTHNPYFPDNLFLGNEAAAHNSGSVSNRTYPTFPPDFGVSQFLDLNNDGFYEAFDDYGNYATVSPVATIDSSQIILGGVPLIRLDAKPKNAAFTYRWLRNGKGVPFNNNDFFIPHQPGLYTVEITGNCGTGISLPYEVNKVVQNMFSSETSNLVTANNKLPFFTTYPNPFTQQFTLSFCKINLPNTIVKVTDVQGRVVMNSKANSTVMHLGEALAKGVYTIQVIQNNTVVFTEKIIKQ